MNSLNFYRNLVLSIHTLSIFCSGLYASSNTVVWLDDNDSLKKTGQRSAVIKPNSYRLDVMGRSDDATMGTCKNVSFAEVSLRHSTERGLQDISCEEVNLTNDSFVYETDKVKLTLYRQSGTLNLSSCKDEQNNFDIVTNFSVTIEDNFLPRNVRLSAPEISTQGLNSTFYFIHCKSIDKHHASDNKNVLYLRNKSHTDAYGDLKKDYLSDREILIKRLGTHTVTFTNQQDNKQEVVIYKTLTEGIEQAQATKMPLSLVSGSYSIVDFPKAASGQNLDVQAVFGDVEVKGS